MSVERGEGLLVEDLHTVTLLVLHPVTSFQLPSQRLPPSRALRSDWTTCVEGSTLRLPDRGPHPNGTSSHSTGTGSVVSRHSGRHLLRRAHLGSPRLVPTSVVLRTCVLLT